MTLFSVSLHTVTFFRSDLAFIHAFSLFLAFSCFWHLIVSLFSFCVSFFVMWSVSRIAIIIIPKIKLHSLISTMHTNENLNPNFRLMNLFFFGLHQFSVYIKNTTSHLEILRGTLRITTHISFGKILTVIAFNIFIVLFVILPILPVQNQNLPNHH